MDQVAFARQLEQVQTELKPLNEIRYWVGQVLRPEQVELLDKTDGKRSVVEQLHGNQKSTEKEASENQRKQNIGR